jgi:hypothetical protein
LREEREYADDLRARIAASPSQSREVPYGESEELLDPSLRDSKAEDLLEGHVKPFVKLIDVCTLKRLIQRLGSRGVDPLVATMITRGDGEGARNGEGGHVPKRHPPTLLGERANHSFSTFTTAAWLELAHRNLGSLQDA